MMKSNYQFISWFPEWYGLHLVTHRGAFSNVYKYSIMLGWFEIRRWR